MNTTIAIVGAGGKMGRRALDRLGATPAYRVIACEKDAAAARRLGEDGYTVSGLAAAVSQSDFVVLAVPDEAIGAISHSVIPLMKPASTLIALDAAAAYIDEIPSRPDITQMITHPCHPALFGHQDTEAARDDHFGGTATQDMIVALLSGSEEVFERGSEICRAMFAPVRRTHRVTVEQFAFLEPAMSEIVVATAATLMRASLDAAIEHGVPREAAKAFMAGHSQIAMAIVFGHEQSPFSDACQTAIQWGTKEIIQPDWRRVFERETLTEAIRVMLRPPAQSEEVVHAR